MGRERKKKSLLNSGDRERSLFRHFFLIRTPYRRGKRRRGKEDSYLVPLHE